jgi:hypothetical protein
MIIRLCIIYWRFHYRVIGWLMNWKSFRRKRLWTKRNSILVFTWSGWGKPRRTSVSIVVVPAIIRTEHLPNTSEERYFFSNLFGLILWPLANIIKVVKSGRMVYTEVYVRKPGEKNYLRNIRVERRITWGTYAWREELLEEHTRGEKNYLRNIRVERRITWGTYA